MSSPALKPFYDYNVNDAYSKLNPLIDRFILFKDSFLQDHPYISGRLKKVKIIQISNSDAYAVNIVLEPPLMKFKSKPTPDQIRSIVQNYERMSEEERKKIRVMDDEFVSSVGEILERQKELKAIPRWKIRERREKKRELVQTVLKAHKDMTERSKDYKREKEVPILISYNPEQSRRIASKESIDSLEAV